MKKLLIIFLFIAVNGYSQDRSLYLHHDTGLYKNDTIIIPRNNPFLSIDVLLYYYDIYEKECSVDSFYYARVMRWEDTSMVLYDFEGYTEYRTMNYGDKIPVLIKTDSLYMKSGKEPTFTGFTNWLKKQ